MNWKIRSVILLVVLFVFTIFTAYEHQPSSIGASRFIKLDHQGTTLQPWQGPWTCILDSQTGLVWENKTDDESIHDALWTFSWYQQGKGVENSGDCYFKPDRCDTEDLIQAVNKEKTCGFNSWRLPTSDELKSIVFNSPKAGEAKITGDFFSHTKRGDYWTADSNIPLEGAFAHLKAGAIAIDFIEGKTRSIPYRNAAFVRLVTNKNKK